MRTRNIEGYQNRFMKKKPCNMCKALNKPERYHPLHLCRNKQQYLEMKKVNMAEAN